MFIRDQGSGTPMDTRREHPECARLNGPAQTPPAEIAAANEINVARLFGGRNEIALRFGEAVYRLKITRKGKLILNK